MNKHIKRRDEVIVREIIEAYLFISHFIFLLHFNGSQKAIRF